LAARLHLAIIQGGLGASGMSWIALFASAKSLVVVHTEFDSAGIADRVTALRC
jgi:hypothetical protein